MAREPHAGWTHVRAAPSITERSRSPWPGRRRFIADFRHACVRRMAVRGSWAVSAVVPVLSTTCASVVPSHGQGLRVVQGLHLAHNSSGFCSSSVDRREIAGPDDGVRGPVVGGQSRGHHGTHAEHSVRGPGPLDDCAEAGAAHEIGDGTAHGVRTLLRSAAGRHRHVRVPHRSRSTPHRIGPSRRSTRAVRLLARAIGPEDWGR